MSTKADASEKVQPEIKVIFKAVGEEPEIITIANTLEEMQRLVGGYIEAVDIGEDLTLWVNEDGISKGLQPNFCIESNSFPVLGPVFIARTVLGSEGYECASVSEGDMETVDKMFES